MNIQPRKKYKNKKTGDLMQPIDLIYDSSLKGYLATGYFNGDYKRFMIRNSDLEFIEEVDDGSV